jgi:outer membrane receptor protein involved in Fe transport
MYSLKFLVPTCAAAIVAWTSSLSAQTGTVEGRVTKDLDGSAVGSVQISVVGTSISTVSAPDGRYTLRRVPAGPQVILFRWLGYQPQEAGVTVRADATETVDVVLSAQIINLADITVESASRTAERIVEAPAAISVISPLTLRNQSITGQAPAALTQVPGVDVVQSGVNDFNVNARGFNSSLNRRVLVLQDGRDLAIAFLGSQEWTAMSLPLEDIGTMEMVRGPGSALYGANAYAGVIDISTPPARDVVGTKLSLGGGELSTFRGDLRHAGVSSDGHFGYKVNAGYYRSGSFSRSRTAFDGSDVISEYNEAAEIPLVAGVTAGVGSCSNIPNCIAVETRPLNGQSINATTGAATGDPDDLQNIYGSGRFDYYLDDGAILTAEGGGSQVQNEIFVTGIGRVQVTKALRPWARLAWAAPNYTVMAWYSGRSSIDPQYSLASGQGLDEHSAILHIEGQFNQEFANDQARLVVGASYRNYNVNTDGTLMALTNDDRSDDYASAYGQIEVKPTPQLRLVVAARVDDGTLFDAQFSPKAAIVYSPQEDHSFRVSVNRAFQTPNYSEFFLQVPAAAPQTGPATLEQNLEGYYATVTNPAVVGPQLAAAMQALSLPTDIPWNFSAQTPVFALGNANLDVEKVTGWEAGYKGNFNDRAYVTADVYYNRLSNFVTDLLPGVNQAQYPSYSLTGETDVLSDLATIDAILATAGLPPSHPLRAGNAQLAAGYNQLSASPIGTPALATLPDGSRAIVVSYANAGKVNEWGIELGVGYGITPEVRVDGTYTYFQFDVQDPGLIQAGQDLVPNTPRNKGSVSLSYTGQQGIDANIQAKFVGAHNWAAGIFAGRIPAGQIVDLSVGYRLNNNIRFYSNVTNLLDQDRFQLYGGSLVGRRVLGGITATF